MSATEFLDNFAAPGIIQVEVENSSEETIIANWLFIIVVASILIIFMVGWRLRSVLTINRIRKMTPQLLCYSITLFMLGLLTLIVPVGISAFLILQTYGSLYVVTGFGISFHRYFAITLGFVFSYYTTYFAYGEHWGRSLSNEFINYLPVATHQRIESLLEVPE
jgi:hypothetical protein